ncbi:UPF0254 family protein [Methanotorris formicicus]|uniref:UPF0254 protein MetfoDRAFT_1586 n=1 Tax=Methanotorris formicicus Mc-S-70 TaxID=647171 RepID=H1L0L2_9EURY|nr:UPF0254 family protein [Methanotorris formicicus]EHP84696.1 protein of unknown function UPF0254 [Methanotorris formicicus Mc-S-70]
MIDKISVATAECFTHAKIGITIHKAASGYEDFEFKEIFDREGLKIIRNVRVLASMFIPSVYAAEKLLNIKLPEPDYSYAYAKAYTEKNDLKVAYLMAKGLKDILNCNIAIGTTAGVGRGGICILTDKNKYTFTTDVCGNLLKHENILERQRNGIEKGLRKFIDVLKDEYVNE